MLQFGSKHVGIEDVHISKHCHEVTGLLLWIGTYCISCVVQQISRVNDLSSPVRYDDSCLAAIRHVQSIICVVRPPPNIRSHSVLYFECYATMQMLADAHISNLGYLWFDNQQCYLITVSDRIQIPSKTTYKDSDRNKGKCILLFY